MEGYQGTDETTSYIRVCGKHESFVERSQSAIIDVDKLKGWVNDAFDPYINIVAKGVKISTDQFFPPKN